MYASKNKRRELFVGIPTVVAIVGNKFFPRLGDWYLGKTGISGQQTQQKAIPGKPDNLYEPLGGDPGAHGRFDQRAYERSPQLWTALHREWVVGGLLAFGLAVAGSFLAANRTRS